VCDIEIGSEDGARSGLLSGLAAVQQTDGATILLFPDAVCLDETGFYTLQQAALRQCQQLGDRVAVLDLQEHKARDLQEAVRNFRDNTGTEGLSYGMAYAPWIYTGYPHEVDFKTLKDHVTSGGSHLDLGTMAPDPAANALVKSVEDALADLQLAGDCINAISGVPGNRTASEYGPLPFASLTMRGCFMVYEASVLSARSASARAAALNTLITFVRDTALGLRESWIGATAFHNRLLHIDTGSFAASETLWRGGLKSLISLQQAAGVIKITGQDAAAVKAGYPRAITGRKLDPWLGMLFLKIPASGKNYSARKISDRLRIIVDDIRHAFNMIAGFADAVLASANAYRKEVQAILYAQHPHIGKWVTAIKKELSRLPPGGAVAGIYARVDKLRGVWRAPANESLKSVTGPVTTISAEEMDNMNVDPAGGKSINVIRSVPGKGTLIWGARTLAGNDNEWRYVSVRRLCNMVEKSCKRATEAFVFEPNDAGSWIKVQTMIEHFLAALWRQGAFQGAKPEHAFYAAVGLGRTMTQTDILEGRMIVEIGLAPVRPAEFIILRFCHKMPEPGN
jgi:hypothetical protein